MVQQNSLLVWCGSMLDDQHQQAISVIIRPLLFAALEVLNEY